MKITFAGPHFFSQADEDLFFAAVYQLPAYQTVTGFGRNLDLLLSDPVDSESADQLLSLFLRWKIDTRGLLHLRPSDSASPSLWEIQAKRANT